jgi:hypothetical protein
MAMTTLALAMLVFIGRPSVPNTPFPGRTPASLQTPGAFLKSILPSHPPTLAGITLGESVASLTQRLGTPAKRFYWAICDTDHESWLYKLHDGAETLDVTITGGLVERVEMSGVRGIGKDSFGVAIGDSLKVLYAKRGRTDDTYSGYADGSSMVVYKINDRINEQFTLQYGLVKRIELGWDTGP